MSQIASNEVYIHSDQLRMVIDHTLEIRRPTNLEKNNSDKNCEELTKSIIKLLKSPTLRL